MRAAFSDYLSPAPIIRFSRNAADGTSPLITASGANEDDFLWQGPGGSFVGKQPDIANFPAGDYLLRCRNWKAVSGINLDDRKLSALEIRKVLPRLSGMTVLSATSNGSLVGDVTPWQLPAGLVYFDLTLCSLLTGDCTNFQLGSATYFGIAATAITGDVSGWRFAAGLTSLNVHISSVTYGTGGLLASVTRDASIYRTYSCGMTTAMVDRTLADCVASNTINSTLSCGGTNQAPTGGATNADYLTLVSRGWTVTITT